MTSYVKSTNFASKDSLASGNPLKIIKGTEFDIEFNNIATAIDSKADTTSPVFAGTPTAPTAAAGTNTTQLATTSFTTSAITSAVAAFREAVYPVGSIYINASNSTNPASLIGFGTWVSFGAGRVPVGFNAADPLFDTAEETGGSKDAVVVSHFHTGTTGGHSADHSHSGTTSGAGSHNHTTTLENTTGAGGTPGAKWSALTSATQTSSATTSTVGDHTHSFSTGGVSSNHTHDFSTGTVGSSGTNANLQPYITVYMWKRTA